MHTIDVLLSTIISFVLSIIGFFAGMLNLNESEQKINTFLKGESSHVLSETMQLPSQEKVLQLLEQQQYSIWKDAFINEQIIGQTIDEQTYLQLSEIHKLYKSGETVEATQQLKALGLEKTFQDNPLVLKLITDAVLAK